MGVLGVEDEVRSGEVKVARASESADGAFLPTKNPVSNIPASSGSGKRKPHESSSSQRALDRDALEGARRLVRELGDERPPGLVALARGRGVDDLEAFLGHGHLGVLGELDKVEPAAEQRTISGAPPPTARNTARD